MEERRQVIMGRFLMLRLGLFVILNDLEVEMDQSSVRDREHAKGKGWIRC